MLVCSRKISMKGFRLVLEALRFHNKRFASPILLVSLLQTESLLARRGNNALILTPLATRGLGLELGLDLGHSSLDAIFQHGFS